MADKLAAARANNDYTALTENLHWFDPEVLKMIMEHEHMGGYDMDAFLQRIACPTLLLQGDPNLGAVLEEDDLSYAVSLLQR